MARTDLGPVVSRIPGLSFRAWLLVLLTAALLQVTLITIYYWPQPKMLVGDEVGYLASAAAIADGRGDPDPMRAPLYGQLLAALGITPARRWPIQLLQLAAFLGTACLMRTLTRRLIGSALAADLAAALTLLYPTLAAFPLYLWPETLHIALWTGAFAILASRRRSVGWLLAAGLLLAVAMLTRHLLLAFLPLVLLALWIDEIGHGDAGSRRALRSVALLVAPVLVIVTPILLADHNTDGRLRSASNVRFNLWVGLNDPSPWRPGQPIVFAAYRDYLSSADTPVERDHLLEERIRDHLTTAGWSATLAGQLQKQYFRLLDRDTIFTAQLPGGWMHGARRGYRRVPPLFTRILRWLDAYLYALLLVGAAWGLWRVRFRHSVWLALAGSFLLYNLLLFLGMHAKSRYFLQMLPFVILFAAAGIAGWLEGKRLGAQRSVAAALLAALLLFLAFGPDWLA